MEVKVACLFIFLTPRLSSCSQKVDREKVISFDKSQSLNIDSSQISVLHRAQTDLDSGQILHSENTSPKHLNGKIITTMSSKSLQPDMENVRIPSDNPFLSKFSSNSAEQFSSKTPKKSSNDIFAEEDVESLTKTGSFTSVASSVNISSSSITQPTEVFSTSTMTARSVADEYERVSSYGLNVTQDGDLIQLSSLNFPLGYPPKSFAQANISLFTDESLIVKIDTVWLHFSFDPFNYIQEEKREASLRNL